MPQDKKCSVCFNIKPLTEFYKNRKTSIGYKAECKNCELERQRKYRKNNNNKITKKYEKTKKGFLMRTYRNMKSRITGVQKKKYHLYKNLELLDKNEFYNYSLNNSSFNILFENWENNNYSQKITPSIDRIDSNKGYTLDNIRWITHSENSRGTRRWNIQ